ncbi:hypothetical protein HG530_012843 [Fusarium avenaceum]|nr:hypothetical protein HG530_012843 [Fusarium avenaceum]
MFKPPSSHSFVALRLTTGNSSVVTDSESPNKDEVIESSRLDIIAVPKRPAKTDEPDVGLSSSRELALRIPIGIGRGIPDACPGDSGRHWHSPRNTSVSLEELMGFSISESK